MRIQVAYTGWRYVSAAGLPKTLELSDSAGLNDALQQLSSLLPEPLPTSCLVTICGRHVGTLADHPNCRLTDGDEVLLIAPIAGG